MSRLLTHLESELMPKIKERNDDGLQSCLCVGQIRGGTNTNIVPASCKAYLDRRLLPSEDVDIAFKSADRHPACGIVLQLFKRDSFQTGKVEKVEATF